MKWLCQHGWRGAFCTLALAVLTPGGASAAEYVLWDKETGRVDANIRTWDVVSVLQRVAASSGWLIYIQPDTKQVLPARFRNLSEGEALSRLLGDLNFAVVGRSNGPAQLYVFRTAREEATQRVAPANSTNRAAKPIEGELVVTLKPGEKIEDLAKRLGATVTGRLDGMNAYRLKFKDDASAKSARRSLLDDPSVASVDSNYYVPQPESPASSSLTPPLFTLQPKAPPDGKYLVVGLIDSAVQPQAGQLSDFLLKGISVAGEAEVPTDSPTHGTAMGQTILSALNTALGKDGSTTVRILPVDVYGSSSDGSTTTFEVAKGVFEAIKDGAKIINMSFGGGDSSLLHEVIQSGHDQGLIFLAAAGNEPTTDLTYPAAYPEVTGVTARDRDGNVVSFANYGDSAKVGGPASSLVEFGGNVYRVVGTSASTAWDSGLMAYLIGQGMSRSKAEATLKTLMPVKLAPPATQK